MNKDRNLLTDERHRRAYRSSRLLGTMSEPYVSIQFLNRDEVKPVAMNDDEVPDHVDLTTMVVFDLESQTYELNLWPISTN